MNKSLGDRPRRKKYISKRQHKINGIQIVFKDRIVQFSKVKERQEYSELRNASPEQER